MQLITHTSRKSHGKDYQRRAPLPLTLYTSGLATTVKIPFGLLSVTCWIPGTFFSPSPSRALRAFRSGRECISMVVAEEGSSGEEMWRDSMVLESAKPVGEIMG